MLEYRCFKQPQMMFDVFMNPFDHVNNSGEINNFFMSTPDLGGNAPI